MRSAKRKIAVLLLFLLCVALVAMTLRPYAEWDQLVAQEDALRNWLGGHPLSGVLLGFIVYAGLSLIPGTTGKSLIAGWLFGFWIGVAVINCGLTAAAMIAFFVSRYLLHDAIQSRFGLYLSHVNRALRKNGGFYLVALRVLHAPFTFVNYALGATPIRTRTFWWATQFGLLPANIVFAYAGARLPTLRSIDEQGIWSVLSADLVAALVVLSIFPFLVQRAARYFRPAAAQPLESRESQAG